MSNRRTSMVERRESRIVPDLSIGLVVLVRVELALMQQLAARGTPVVVGAAAVHVHHLARELDAAIEATPLPLTAPAAAVEPAGNVVSLGVGQHDDFLEGRRPAAFRRIS